MEVAIQAKDASLQTSSNAAGRKVSPLTDVREIASIAYGFMASKTLFAALNLGVFDALQAAPRCLEALSRETGRPANLLEALLAACTSLGLIEFDGASYSNAPATQRYLVRSARNYFGDYYRFQIDRQFYPNLIDLDRALAGEEVAGPYTGGFKDGTLAEDFTRGQHSGSLGPAHVLAREVDLDGAERLLDAGGGSGAFSIMLCRRFPGLTATIIDFPNVLQVARRFVDEARLADRIGFVSASDGFAAWPDGADAVLMSYLCSAVGGASEDFIARAFEVLRPGGRLLIHDFMVADHGRGPRLAALWSLAMVMGNPDARVLQPDRLRAALGAVGFANIRMRPLIPETTSLIEASRP